MPKEIKVLEKPVKPGGKKSEPTGKLQKSSTAEKSSKSERSGRPTGENTKLSREMTKSSKTVEQSSSSKKSFREKYESATKEERKLMRQERRERKSAKAKTTKEESSEDEDADGDDNPAAPVDFNANLSNQNNITINNTGLEDIAKAMNKLANMPDEKTKQNSKSETVDPVRVISDPGVVRVDIAKQLASKANDQSLLQERFSMEMPDRKIEKKFAKFRRGAVMTEIITISTLQQAIVTFGPANFYHFVWRLIFMLPDDVVVVLMALFNLWVRDEMTDDEFIDGIVATCDHSGATNADAFKWFLCQNEDIADWWVICKYHGQMMLSWGGGVATDHYGWIDPGWVKMTMREPRINSRTSNW